MSENPLRKGQRAKKPPKYLQYDEAEYGISLPGKNAEQKEKVGSSAQINQIARILSKFVSNISERLRQQNLAGLSQGLHLRNEQGIQNHLSLQNLGRSFEQLINKSVGNQTVDGRRRRDSHEFLSQVKNFRSQMKKGTSTSRQDFFNQSVNRTHFDFGDPANSQAKTPSLFQKQGHQNSSKVADLAAKKLFQEQIGKTKGKDQQNKIQPNGKASKFTKDAKNESKAVKRQFFHVAVANLIFHKQMLKKNPSSTSFDPTYAARKLRQSHFLQEKIAK